MSICLTESDGTCAMCHTVLLCTSTYLRIWCVSFYRHGTYVCNSCTLPRCAAAGVKY